MLPNLYLLVDVFHPLWWSLSVNANVKFHGDTQNLKHCKETVKLKSTRSKKNIREMSTAVKPFTLMQLLLKFLEFRSLRMAITYMCICNQEVSDSIDLSQPLHTKVINHFLCECSVLIFNLLFHQSQIQSSWSKEKPAKKTLILHQKTKSMRWKHYWMNILKKMTISKLRWWKIVSVSDMSNVSPAHAFFVCSATVGVASGAPQVPRSSPQGGPVLGRKALRSASPKTFPNKKKTIIT